MDGGQVLVRLKDGSIVRGEVVSERGDGPSDADGLEGMTPEVAALVEHMLDHAIEVTDRMHKRLDETIRYIRSDD